MVIPESVVVVPESVVVVPESVVVIPESIVVVPESIVVVPDAGEQRFVEGLLQRDVAQIAVLVVILTV